MTLSKLYREFILKHAHDPANQQGLERADLKAEIHNVHCGDHLELTLNLKERAIDEVGLRARGCAVMNASAAIMRQTIVGLSLTEAQIVGHRFQATLEGETVPNQEMGNLKPLLALKEKPGVHSCLMLPWMALDDCTAEQEKLL